jgi:hypothetical protein
MIKESNLPIAVTVEERRAVNAPIAMCFLFIIFF